MIDSGVQDRRAAFHIAQVASIDQAGKPCIRSMVLRGFDPSANVLLFHTDHRSPKVKEIRDRPHIALHFYDREAKIQLRLACDTKLQHDDFVSASVWQLLNPASRKCYEQSCSPGEAIATPELLHKAPALDGDDAFQNFSILRAKISTIEWLYLSAFGHRRARFSWCEGEHTRTWLAA